MTLAHPVTAGWTWAVVLASYSWAGLIQTGLSEELELEKVTGTNSKQWELESHRQEEAQRGSRGARKALWGAPSSPHWRGRGQLEHGHPGKARVALNRHSEGSGSAAVSAPGQECKLLNEFYSSSPK